MNTISQTSIFLNKKKVSISTCTKAEYPSEQKAKQKGEKKKIKNRKKIKKRKKEGKEENNPPNDLVSRHWERSIFFVRLVSLDFDLRRLFTRLVLARVPFPQKKGKKNYYCYESTFQDSPLERKKERKKDVHTHVNSWLEVLSNCRPTRPLLNESGLSRKDGGEFLL